MVDVAQNRLLRRIWARSLGGIAALSSRRGKLYCAAAGDTLVVIDCRTDSLVGRVCLGQSSHPSALAYDSVNDRIYSASRYAHTVSVINCRNDSLVVTIPVGSAQALAWDAVNLRVFAANAPEGTVSVIRDSLRIGVREGGTAARRYAVCGPTIVSGVLWLAPAASFKLQAASLLDISGRRVMDLHPGPNDVRHLSPGVYFVTERRTHEHSAVKVVVE